VTIKGVTGISMSPATSGPELFRLAAFIPEGKGSPASAGVYDWSAGGVGGHSEPQPLVKKSFFRTQGDI
jgi:translation initiation factor 2A